jgi:hypothetical protein
VEEKDILKKLLTTPPVKKIDLHFPLGLEVTARNLKGVTIKDALDAIHKQFKKRVSSCLWSFVSSSVSNRDSDSLRRPTTNLTCPIWQGSSGTRRSHGLA